jgi:hypothetical protein
MLVDIKSDIERDEVEFHIGNDFMSKQILVF